VLDAVGSERTAVYAKWFGGALAISLATEHPARVSALVLWACAARGSWAPDYDWAMTGEERERFVEEILAEWGEDHTRELARWAPSMADDPVMAAWMGRFTRAMASPGEARSRWREANAVDVRPLLPRIEVPTLIMHRPREHVWDVRHSRYLAEHIPGARYVELDGEDAIEFVGDSESVIEEIHEFLTGERGVGAGSRALLTVMFSDVVDSTSVAGRLGDTAWRDLLAKHHQLVRGELIRFGGREVKTMGDGFLATFDGPPSSALNCAASMVAAVSQLGIEIRVGLHTGECDVIGDDVGGMAVHVAARIGALAEPGQVIVSGGVAEAVAGGDFEFERREARTLKGVPGEWPLFALER
jgi:class 3 adenylate cyclase